MSTDEVPLDFSPLDFSPLDDVPLSFSPLSAPLSARFPVAAPMSTPMSAPMSTPMSAPMSAPMSMAPRSDGHEELWSYDQIHHANARMFRPQNARSLATLLRALSRQKERQRVTFRGGGQAIDGQAINDEIVIVMDSPELRSISEPKKDDAGYYVTIGAAATWGDILRKTMEWGLLPYSVVTTSRATMGGTVAADCLSRCSPISGREGAHVRSFEMVTATGETITCRRNDRDPDRRALYHAVIGGFGYLGVITQVTIDLRPPLPGWTPERKIRVATRVDKHIVGGMLGSRWPSLLPSLRERETTEDVAEFQDGFLDKLFHFGEARPRVGWDAVSSGAWYAFGQIEALLFRSRYVLDREVDPMPLHRRADSMLQLLARGMAEPSLTELAEGAMFLLYPSDTYVDEVDDFTFFMENQISPAREAALKAGIRLNSVQQTFVIPAAETPSDPEGIAPTERFLDLVRPTMFDDPDAPSLLDPMRPTLIDVLYLPADEFLLSASRGQGGYAVTLSFTELDGRGWETLRARLRELSKRCLELGGRVHMVKNVEADSPVLWKMYGDAFDRFLWLKQKWDPKGMIGNEFFDRIFRARPLVR